MGRAKKKRTNRMIKELNNLAGQTPELQNRLEELLKSWVKEAKKRGRNISALVDLLDHAKMVFSLTEIKVQQFAEKCNIYEQLRAKILKNSVSVEIAFLVLDYPKYPEESIRKLVQALNSLANKDQKKLKAILEILLAFLLQEAKKRTNWENRAPSGFKLVEHLERLILRCNEKVQQYVIQWKIFDILKTEITKGLARSINPKMYPYDRKNSRFHRI